MRVTELSAAALGLSSNINSSHAPVHHHEALQQLALSSNINSCHARVHHPPRGIPPACAQHRHPRKHPNDQPSELIVSQSYGSILPNFRTYIEGAAAQIVGEHAAFTTPQIFQQGLARKTQCG